MKLSRRQPFVSGLHYRWKREGSFVLLKVYDGRRLVGGISGNINRFSERNTHWACKDALLHAASASGVPMHRFGTLPDGRAKPGNVLTVSQTYLRDEWQGVGVGKQMYLLLADLVAPRMTDPFLFTSFACVVGSGTSQSAQRVWASLARDHGGALVPATIYGGFPILGAVLVRRGGG